MSNQMQLRLYIETAPITNPLGRSVFPPPPSKAGPKVLVFIKLFDPFTQDIRYGNK